MRYPQSFLDEIRARVPVSIAARKLFKIKRQGKEWVALSPFNVERSPSFTIADAKGFWHDFSSGKHGDVIALLVEVQGLTFKEAVETLASECGLPIPQASEATVKAEAHRAGLVEILEMANSFFQLALLQKSEEAAAARDYLVKRQLAPGEWDAFSIGLALSDRSALKSFLASKGVDQGAMIEAGLLIAGDDIPVSYDRFRNRIMFPIRDARGATIAFSGRTLAREEGVPKYLNSPETPTFQKGRCLYNVHAARRSAHDGETAVAVEGYTGCIASIRAGFPATVATMGTAITPDQLRALWRMSDVPIVCLDGDLAGSKAARKVVETAFPELWPGQSLRFAFMPRDQDPDDVVTKRGPEAFKTLLRSSVSLPDMLWRSVAIGQPMDSPESRQGVEAELLGIVAGIRDEGLRAKYAKEMRDRIEAVPQRPRMMRSNGFSNHSTSVGAGRLAHGYIRAPGLTIREASIVAAVADNPESAADAFEDVTLGLSPVALAAVNSIVEGVLAGETSAADLERRGGETLNEALLVSRRAGLTFEPGRHSLAATSMFRRR